MLTQPKIRDQIRSISKVHADQLLTAVIASMRRPNNFGCVVTKEVMTRFLAHICFCKGEVLSNEQMDKTIKLMNTLAFTYKASDKNIGELTKEQLSQRN